MKILVVSPHPDDETLGAGGTLLKFKKGGNRIFWLNFTDMSQEYGYLVQDVMARQTAIKKVRKAYSFDGYYNLGLKPCFLLEYPRAELIDKTAKIFAEIQPEVIIVPFKNDSHSDHRIIFEIVYSCTKVFRAPSVKEILMMEVASETEFASSENGFIPNYFVDISSYLDKKILIMKNYDKELCEHPFPRSALNIRALATYRGATAGCKYAESFMLLKAIH